MNCRQFEDAMYLEFAEADADRWRDLITKERWDQLPASVYSDHLKECRDCPTSLWQFFQVRGRIDYTSEPCFHVAYYSSNVPDRCLDKIHGMYTVATMDHSGNGVVIAMCPWCGVPLPTGAKDQPTMARLR